jgi:hypothetical protein
MTLGRADETRDDPDQIRKQDKNEKGHEDQGVAPAIVADLILRLTVDEFVDQFKDVLQLTGLVHGQIAAQYKENGHDQERHQDLHDHEIRPWLFWVIGRLMEQRQQGVAGTCEVGIEQPG